jgi:HTH-type transcriptional regulator/antitoxin HigA
MDIKPIRTAEDHTAALREIEGLWGAEEGTPEGDKLDVLATLVERYEALRFTPPASSPTDAVRFIMEQNDYSQSDLAEVLGSRSRASEFLNRKRDLTLDQIRRLSRTWHIPADVLIGDLATA